MTRRILIFYIPGVREVKYEIHTRKVQLSALFGAVDLLERIGEHTGIGIASSVKRQAYLAVSGRRKSRCEFNAVVVYAGK